MKYSKQPLDIPALLAMLKTRGLIIGDGQQAKRLFGVFSYFRLANYLHPMEADNETHQYKPNSSFENYRFDTALREIVLRAISYIQRFDLSFLQCDKSSCAFKCIIAN